MRPPPRPPLTTVPPCACCWPQMRARMAWRQRAAAATPTPRLQRTRHEVPAASTPSYNEMRGPAGSSRGRGVAWRPGVGVHHADSSPQGGLLPCPLGPQPPVCGSALTAQQRGPDFVSPLHAMLHGCCCWLCLALVACAMPPDGVGIAPPPHACTMRASCAHQRGLLAACRVLALLLPSDCALHPRVEQASAPLPWRGLRWPWAARCSAASPGLPILAFPRSVARRWRASRHRRAREGLPCPHFGWRLMCCQGGRCPALGQRRRGNWAAGHVSGVTF